MRFIDYDQMKIIANILVLFILTSCVNRQHRENNIHEESSTITADDDNKPQIRYTDQQLENYLDSIGSLPPSLLTDDAYFVVDSIFKNQQQMNRIISQSDFSKLKHVIKEENEIDRVIDIETAERIFGKIQVDSSFLEEGKIPVTLFSFDNRKNDFNEYAICLGYSDMAWNCTLYFLKSNKIIAKHEVFHRHGLVLEHYRDSDGKTIIHYRVNLGSGTGIWQYNFFFYKFYDDKLIPILNELKNGNLDYPWGPRISWMETFVTKTSPLTLKMVYYQEFFDTTSGSPARIIDDSTFVQYAWDEKSRTLVGDYGRSKINQSQTLTYYITNNELLFINTYYATLKECLKDKGKRQLTLNYLNEVKDHYENN